MRKTIIKMVVAFFLLFIISCSKQLNNKPALLPTQPVALTAPTINQISPADSLYVGKLYGGGVIFYLNNNKKHGLIADTMDIGTDQWGYTNTDWGTLGVAIATKPGIGTGMQNTRNIVSKQGVGTYAAYLCSKHKGGGHTDWFLPSKEELYQLYLQRDVVGHFPSTGYNYWSSTEKTVNKVWTYAFIGNGWILYGKTDRNNVRPVRAF